MQRTAYYPRRPRSPLAACFDNECDCASRKWISGDRTPRRILKDSERGINSVKQGLFSFVRILPTVLTIVVIIGLLLGFVPPETIQQFVGERSGPIGIILTAVVGSMLHIPSLVAFPLAASFLELGASITVTAVFITTLTMIGVVTLPLEIRELG